MRWDEIERLARVAEESGGAVGVRVIAPDGDGFGYRGDRAFRAASTVKIPLMVAIYRQIDAGERSLDDIHELRAEEKTPGSGILLHLHDGIPLTLGDLLYLMMSISDNTATNLLIEMAGMENVNAVMRALGMKDSVLGRKMTGKPAAEGMPENWATPDDYARAIQAILTGEAASAWACEQMLATLEKQQNPRRIARHLPEGEGIRWGSKTGSIKGVTNDVGFISAGGNTLIVSVFCENLPDGHTGEQVIGAISRAAMQATGVVAPSFAS